MEKPINTRLNTDFGGKNFTYFFKSAIQELRAVFYLLTFAMAGNEETSECLAREFGREVQVSHAKKNRLLRTR